MDRRSQSTGVLFSTPQGMLTGLLRGFLTHKSRTVLDSYAGKYHTIAIIVLDYGTIRALLYGSEHVFGFQPIVLCTRWRKSGAGQPNLVPRSRDVDLVALEGRVLAAHSRFAKSSCPSCATRRRYSRLTGPDLAAASVDSTSVC